MTVAILFAISNMELIELQLWPLPGSSTIPVYVLTLGIFTIGFFAGGFISWITAGKMRKRVHLAERELKKERREIVSLNYKLDKFKLGNRNIEKPHALITNDSE